MFWTKKKAFVEKYNRQNKDNMENKIETKTAFTEKYSRQNRDNIENKIETKYQ